MEGFGSVVWEKSFRLWTDRQTQTHNEIYACQDETDPYSPMLKAGLKINKLINKKFSSL